MKKLLLLCALLTAQAVPSTAFAREISINTITQYIRGGVPQIPANEWEAIGTIPGCTATLITEFAALTAAHCVSDGERKTFTLPNDRGSIEGTVTVHPEFGVIKWVAYDYAVIRFDQSIYDDVNVNTDGLKPIPISAKHLSKGDGVFLYGYGGFSNSGAPCSSGPDGSPRLAAQSIGDVNEDWHYSIKNDKVGSCPGDSGGPLVYYDKALTVVAVNSWKAAKSSFFKPTYLVYDWIRENSSDPVSPGETWGNCVYYTDFIGGNWYSVRGNFPSIEPSSWDNQFSAVWVKKGFKATLYDGSNYGGGVLAELDGFTGKNCNEFGCAYDIKSTAADNKTSSMKCEQFLPGDTWGHCVFYDRYGNGGYLSMRGDHSSFKEYKYWNNRATHIWVKRGHNAELFPNTKYSGSPFWDSIALDGTNGDWCNNYGCLHDLVGTTAENAASSIRCD